MTNDKQEIKALALACDPAKCADEVEEGRRLAEFYSELTPEAVLALLAEIDRLDRESQNLSNQLGDCDRERRSFRAERDQLKAENEALRVKLEVSEDTRQVLRGILAQAEADIDALREDAERYRWLRSRDLDSISKGGVFAGMTPENLVLNEETLDQVIDAARAKQV